MACTAPPRLAADFLSCLSSTQSERPSTPHPPGPRLPAPHPPPPILQIDEGRLWFQLDCSKSAGILGISGRPVNDGNWHSVSLELNRNFTSLSLDDSYVERRRAPVHFQPLGADGSIYFGAQVQPPNSRSLTERKGTGVLGGFQGCLDSLVLNNNELPLQNKRSRYAEVVGLTELKLGCVLYPDACQRAPCLNAGSCTSLPSGGESAELHVRSRIRVAPMQSRPCFAFVKVCVWPALLRAAPNCEECPPGVT